MAENEERKRQSIAYPDERDRSEKKKQGFLESDTITNRRRMLWKY